MNYSASSLKFSVNSEMLALIRAIIYHRNLHWGAKVLGLALLDIPRTTQPTTAALARKLHTSHSQVSIWRQELIRNQIKIRVGNIQP